MSVVLNLNVGILGHVDCGKTTLAKALSSVASTAAFDKNPQSKERGITLDLGFSSFSVDAPDFLQGKGYSLVQFTLVDCPGHASLIRTVIGGAQIIDLMILVIDITKGIQTQTGECLIIGEITCDRMIVALNKIDAVTDENRENVVMRMRKRIKNVLSETRFAKSEIVCISAATHEVEELLISLKSNIFEPERNSNSDTFLLYVDHCFQIRGQGTVLTGTVISGSIEVGKVIEIPSLKTKHTVKSIQVFRKPVKEIRTGDRAGICVTQLDSIKLERGIVSSLGGTQQFSAIIARIKPIRYFRRGITCGDKFHITVGYSTVMARIIALFHANCDFNINKDYLLIQEVTLSDNAEYFVLLSFENPIICVQNTIIIASRLDSDVNANACRIAFHGCLVTGFKNHNDYTALKIYKVKHKEGIVERLLDEQTMICTNLFKRETNISIFSGLKVMLSTGETAVIESSFGQTGKCKLRLLCQISDKAKSILDSKRQSKKGKARSEDLTLSLKNTEQIEVFLEFKKYMFQNKMKIFQ